MVGVAAMVSTVAVAVALAGGVAATASRAQGAADAAALGAAADARDLRAMGAAHASVEAEACAEARLVAKEWGVRVARCSVDGRGAVSVTVDVRSPAGSVRRDSRAGTR